MSRPVFYLLAGPNGAGKSTLYQAAIASGLIPAEVPFINADLYEASSLRHLSDPMERSQAARLWADAQRSRCVSCGVSFASETVFSHPSKIDLIHAARQADFLVILLVVCVDDPQQLLRRVSQRTKKADMPFPTIESWRAIPEPCSIWDRPCDWPTWPCCMTRPYHREKWCSHPAWWRDSSPVH